MDVNLLISSFPSTYDHNKVFFNILFIILGGLIAHAVAEKIFVQIFRVVKRKDTRQYTRRDMRAQTLLRVTNNFVNSLITIIIIVLILTALNINLGAIFAVSSIIGVAVGFGSQSFIKDVINGIFFLYQDQVGEGDFVTTSGITGVIEDVSIRTVTIRDLQGAVTMMENGNISQITNYSKKPYKLFIDTQVATSNKIDVISGIMDEAIEQFKGNPKNILLFHSIKLLGIHDISGGKMTMRVRISTNYRHQYTVGRAFRLILKQKFEEHNIEFN